MRLWSGRLHRWWPSLLMMTAIFAFSSIPSSEMPNFGLWDFVAKKGGHALGYGLLALTYRRGFGPDKRLLWRAWILAVGYSATDEFHQSMVPGRNSSLMDIGIDAFGSALALALANFHLSKSSRRGPSNPNPENH